MWTNMRSIFRSAPNAYSASVKVAKTYTTTASVVASRRLNPTAGFRRRSCAQPSSTSQTAVLGSISGNVGSGWTSGSMPNHQAESTATPRASASAPHPVLIPVAHAVRRRAETMVDSGPTVGTEVVEHVSFHHFRPDVRQSTRAAHRKPLDQPSIERAARGHYIPRTVATFRRHGTVGKLHRPEEQRTCAGQRVQLSQP